MGRWMDRWKCWVPGRQARWLGCVLNDHVTFKADGLRPGKRLTFSPLVPKDFRVRRL